MEYVALGKTNLLVSRTSFGAMSLDCKEIEALGEEAEEKACALVRHAYDSGVNFFDVSHSRPVCESRLGASLHGIRQNVFVATKSCATNGEVLKRDLDSSLELLESDFVDVFQIENNDMLPVAGSLGGVYETLLQFRTEGIAKHIGFATENIELARAAVESGFYETVQFPFNVLSGKLAEEIVELCDKCEIGCIAMQPLNGGVMSNIPLAFGFLRQFEHVIPVWGVHTQEELQQILYFDNHPPIIDEQFKLEAEKIRNFFN